MADFKGEFQNQLQSLDEAITAAVTSNNERNTTFSNTVIANLTEINDRIATLAEGIRRLKQELTGLQNQMQQNTGQIDANANQMDALRAENAQLSQANQNLQNEFEQLRSNIDTHQHRIDELEGQVRQLTQERDTLIQERDSIRQELTQTGDDGAAHATQIQRLTESHRTELQQQTEDCTRRIEEINNQLQPLREEIVRKDTEIESLTRELASKNTEIEQLNVRNTENDERYAELQGLNQNLQAENAELADIIRNATTTIRSAIERMQEFNNPNAFNERDKNRILSEINAAINEISLIIDRAPNQGPPPMQASPMQASPRPNVTPNSSKKYTWPLNIGPVTINGKTYDTNNLIKQLEAKANQNKIDRNTNRPSKYVVALQDIQSAIENGRPDQIAQIFTNNISLNKNGIILGGKTKKRRKYKKQRGGFTYKQNAKRKTFSTTLNIAKGNSKKTSKRFKK